MRSSIDILSEQVLRIVLSGNTNSDKELKKEDVRLYVTQALYSIIRRRFYEYKSEGEEYIDGSYIYAFEDVEVKKSDSLNLYYSDLPASTIDLPNGVGIYSVGYMQDQSSNFIQVPNTFNSLFKGLRSSALSGNIGYYKEGKKIFYTNMPNKETCKVLIKIVAPLGDLGKCNSFDLPMDMQEEVIARAVQLYVGARQLPDDNENNNISK